MIVKNAKPLNILLIKLRSRWRVLFGFCPMCNSDAPAVDSCSLCDSHHRATDGEPSGDLKQKWLADHDEVLDSMARTRKLIKAHRS